jgi:hypothetical protein
MMSAIPIRPSYSCTACEHDKNYSDNTYMHDACHATFDNRYRNLLNDNYIYFYSCIEVLTKLISLLIGEFSEKTTAQTHGKV